MRQPKVFFDHTDFPWLKLWCGYRHNKSDNFYMRPVAIYLSLMLGCGLYSVLFEPNVRLKVEILHIVVLDLLTIVNLLNEHYHGNEVGEAVEYFQGWTVDHDYSTNSTSLRQLYVKRVHAISCLNIVAYFTCLTLYMFFEPIKGYLSGQGWTVHPVPHYFPFDISFGYALIAMGLMEFSFVFVVWTMVTSFMGLTMQFKAQFRILNTSLGQLERRVLAKLQVRPKMSRAEARVLCLVENIKHHQEIIRNFNSIKKYLDNIFSSVVFLSALLLATKCFLLVKECNEPAACSNHLFSLLVEYVFHYIFCLLGEMLTIESMKVRNSFYSIKWWEVDRLSRNLIKTAILLSANIYVKIKSHFNAEASLRVFSSVTSSTYSLVNLLVSTDLN